MAFAFAGQIFQFVARQNDTFENLVLGLPSSARKESNNQNKELLRSYCLNLYTVFSSQSRKKGAFQACVMLNLLRSLAKPEGRLTGRSRIDLKLFAITYNITFFTTGRSSYCHLISLCKMQNAMFEVWLMLIWRLIVHKTGWFKIKIVNSQF